MITIIVPTFNRQDYISETLDSLLKQTHQDWECIIVDDGSTDETEEILQKFLLDDKRFSFYYRPAEMPKGANSCRNFGFLKAKGHYIKFLDSDDLLTTDCLEKQFAILEADQTLKVCLSYGRYFSDSTKKLQEYWSRNKEYPNYLFGHIVNQIRWAVSDPLWRKSFFVEVPFKEGLMNSQEWLMHGEAMLTLKKEEIYNLKESFTLIRRGNVRMSSGKSSNYYKNQKLSRIYLFKTLLNKKEKKISYYYQLSKQILVYYYWQVKQK